MHRPDILRFDSTGLDSPIRLISDSVSLAEGQRESWETITRVVRFDDPVYGEVDVNRAALNQMVRNFQGNVFGQDIAVDIAHQPMNGAAGFVRDLAVENNKLRGRIEWTEQGVDAVVNKGYRYFSAEYHEDYKDPESGKHYGKTLLGAALTTRPRIKRLDPVDPKRLQLSFDGIDGDLPAVAPRIIKSLCEESEIMKDKFIKLFAIAMQPFTHLNDHMVKQFSDQFDAALDGIDNDTRANILLSTFTASAEMVNQQLSDTKTPGSIRLDFSGLPHALSGVGQGLSKEAVLKLMSDQQQADNLAAQQRDDAMAANLKLFSDAIDGQDGFSDDLKNDLKSFTSLITPEMTPDQIKSMSDQQIKWGNKLTSQAKLLAMGMPSPAGAVRISVDDSNSVTSLQETVDRRLGILEMSDARRYAPTGGALLDENKRFAEQVLSQFDAENAAALRNEHKLMAAGDGLVSDVSVPVVWERTVIREALYRLVGLQFVDVGTEQFATSYSIPYSYRDTTSAGVSATRKYEGQSIARAGVIQTAETAYNLPQKLAFEVSDELRYLTAARHLNWDAVSENQRNASRIIGEDTEAVIFNEVLRAADEYGATAVTSENLELQADGSDTVFILAQFPVVRPRAVYDLQGTQVGSTSNAITVTYNSVVLEEYDGTGTQSAGSYYSLDYNLGEITKVDESGVAEIPADSTAYTISYSYSTNVYKFDTDLGSNDMDVHWDGFLYRYGLRKSVIEDDRYHMANFGLMSGTVMTQIEQAKQFGANSKRAGTDLAMDGNLGRIKDVPNFKTSAPSLWMGDQRAIIGERAQTRLRMTKPWTLGELENQKDANGRFTGKKEAYGDQFIVCHTPTQIKRAYTSILLYGATARVAR